MFAITEILECEASNYNKQYFDLIGSLSLIVLSDKYIKNSIARHYASVLYKKLGITKVKQFLNEFKFPRFSKFEEPIKLIFQTSNKLFNSLLNRKQMILYVFMKDYLLVAIKYHQPIKLAPNP